MHGARCRQTGATLESQLRQSDSLPPISQPSKELVCKRLRMSHIDRSAFAVAHPKPDRPQPIPLLPSGYRPRDGDFWPKALVAACAIARLGNMATSPLHPEFCETSAIQRFNQICQVGLRRSRATVHGRALTEWHRRSQIANVFRRKNSRGAASCRSSALGCAAGTAETWRSASLPSSLPGLPARATTDIRAWPSTLASRS